MEGEGGPLGVVAAGANVHDAKLLNATIEAIVIERPEAEDEEQHLCLDKGYDNPTGRAAAVNGDYVPHIRRIGEEKLDDQKRKRHPARRWVVERTLGWLRRCRAIVRRYNKKSSNWLGLIQLASVLLWFRRAWRLQAEREAILR